MIEHDCADFKYILGYSILFYSESLALCALINTITLEHREQWLHTQNSLSLAQRTNKNNLGVGGGSANRE